MNALTAQSSPNQFRGPGTTKEQSNNGPYCVDTFWKLMQDDSPFNTQMTSLALQAFVDIFQSSLCNKYIMPYLSLCVENIKNSTSVYQSLYVAEILITQSCINEDVMQYPNSILSISSEMVEKINTDFNLVELIIKSLVKYRRFSDPKLEQYPQKQQSAKVIEGKYSHDHNVRWRAKLLLFILSNSATLKFSEEHLSTLWNEYVVLCKASATRSLFLRLLLFEDKNCNLKKLKRLFSLKGLSFILDSLYARHNELALECSMVYYKCFHRYFKLVNILKGKLEESDYLRVIDLEGVYGLEALWDISLCCANEEVRLSFCKLLVSFYLYLSESLRSVRINIWNLFVEKVTGKLKEVDNEKMILNLINLLLAFFRRMDGEEYSNLRVSSNKEVKITFDFILKPGKMN